MRGPVERNGERKTKADEGGGEMGTDAVGVNEVRSGGFKARLCDIKLPECGVTRRRSERDAPSLIEPPPPTCREHMCWWQRSDWKPDGLFSLLPPSTNSHLLPLHPPPRRASSSRLSVFGVSFFDIRNSQPPPRKVPQ